VNCGFAAELYTLLDTRVLALVLLEDTLRRALVDVGECGLLEAGVTSLVQLGVSCGRADWGGGDGGSWHQAGGLEGEGRSGGGSTLANSGGDGERWFDGAGSGKHFEYR